MRFSDRIGQSSSFVLCCLFLWMNACTVQAQSDWKKEWERNLQEAKKEALIVVGIPARAELRKELEAVFKPKFGIDMDMSTARGPQNASKIAAEFTSGVKNFDVFIGVSGTYEPLLEVGMTETQDPMLILRKVKGAKNWMGGHPWAG